MESGWLSFNNHIKDNLLISQAGLSFRSLIKDNFLCFTGSFILDLMKHNFLLNTTDFSFNENLLI